jgi:signal transduction histidine kinase
MNHDTVESLQAEKAILQAELSRSQQEQQALEHHLQSLHAVLKRLYVTQEAERSRLSRQLHDEAGQALTGLKMDLMWLQNCLGQEEEVIGDKLKAMNLLVDDAVFSLRAVMEELRPSILDDFGLAAAVEWQLHRFQARTGIRCHVQTPHGEPALDRTVSGVLFRVFKELLDNLHRHAYASRVDVQILMRGDELIFQVQDNGRGITEQEISARESLGLISIQEQLSIIGAKVYFSGIPGKGTIATIRLPSGS